MFWNAFPFYPHETTGFMKLRNPSDTEIRNQSWYIKEILGIFSTVKYVTAIGRKAQIGITEALKLPTYVKHPSRNSVNFQKDVQNIIKDNLGKIK